MMIQHWFQIYNTSTKSRYDPERFLNIRNIINIIKIYIYFFLIHYTVNAFTFLYKNVFRDLYEIICLFFKKPLYTLFFVHYIGYKLFYKRIFTIIERIIWTLDRFMDIYFSSYKYYVRNAIYHMHYDNKMIIPFRRIVLQYLKF